MPGLRVVPGEGRFTGLALETGPGHRIFTKVRAVGTEWNQEKEHSEEFKTMIGQFLVRLTVLIVCVSILMGRSDQVYRAENNVTYVTRVEDGVLRCGHATPANMDLMEKIQARVSRARPVPVQTNLAQPAAEFIVTFTGFTPAAQAAFQRAVDIWASTLITTVPVEIDADFVSADDLEDPEEYETTLAFVRPSQSWAIARISDQQIAVPIALANQRSDRDRDPGEPDFAMTVIDRSDWYLGLDGRPETDQFDLVSVVLHEISHGLGIVDSFDLDDDGNGRYGLVFRNRKERIPTLFDYFIRLRNGDQLVADLSSPSAELADAITGIKLFWAGAQTRRANGGRTHALLWAPSEYEVASSIAHLDEDAYPSGTSNSLMTPQIARGEVSQSPGPLLRAMLKDMDYAVRGEDLQIPHFGVGDGLNADIVVTNRSSSETAAVSVNAWDPQGNELDGDTLLGTPGADRFDLPPLGSRTLTLSAGGGGLLTGSITVSTDDIPVSAVVRFDLVGTGIAGVGAGPRLRAAVAPARRSGGLSTGIAVRNAELAEQRVDLTLKDESGEEVAGGTSSRTIQAGGQFAAFIQELFPHAVTTDFKGEICIRAQAGLVSVVALELEPGRAFTTLPVSPIAD